MIFNNNNNNKNRVQQFVSTREYSGRFWVHISDTIIGFVSCSGSCQISRFLSRCTRQLANTTRLTP
ncbi:hypothetical protein Hanom_Chr07g00652631 [Helianthus anomalus]